MRHNALQTQQHQGQTADRSIAARNEYQRDSTMETGRKRSNLPPNGADTGSNVFTCSSLTSPFPESQRNRTHIGAKSLSGRARSGLANAQAKQETILLIPKRTEGCTGHWIPRATHIGHAGIGRQQIDLGCCRLGRWIGSHPLRACIFVPGTPISVPVAIAINPHRIPDPGCRCRQSQPAKATRQMRITGCGQELSSAEAQR
jgi:hypothetical protein